LRALVEDRVERLARNVREVGETARVLKPGGSFLLIDGSVPDDDPEQFLTELRTAAGVPEAAR